MLQQLVTIRYELATKSVNLIELVHLSVLLPYTALRFRYTGSTKCGKAIRPHTHNLRHIAQIMIGGNLKNIGQRNLFLFKVRR